MRREVSTDGIISRTGMSVSVKSQVGVQSVFRNRQAVSGWVRTVKGQRQRSMIEATS